MILIVGDSIVREQRELFTDTSVRTLSFPGSSLETFPRKWDSFWETNTELSVTSVTKIIIHLGTNSISSRFGVAPVETVILNYERFLGWFCHFGTFDFSNLRIQRVENSLKCNFEFF